MATLIENVAAVKSAAQAIDAAIVAKGGTTAGGLVNAAAAISDIGRYSSHPYWNPPAGWPNLRKLIAEDEEDYAYKFAFLVPCYDLGIMLSGCSAYKTSDGRLYTTSNVTHTWGEPSASDVIAFGVPIRWVIAYSNERSVRHPVSSYFGVNPATGRDKTGPADLLWVVSNGGELSVDGNSFYAAPRTKIRSIECDVKCGGINYTFKGLVSLVCVDGNVDCTGSPDIGQVFNGCTALRFVKSMSGTAGKSSSTTFSECLSLEHAPSGFDVNRVGEIKGCFTNCRGLLEGFDDISNTSTAGFEWKAVGVNKLADSIVLPGVTSLASTSFYAAKYSFLCDRFELTGLTSAIPATTFSSMTALKAVPPVFHVSQSFQFTQTSFDERFKSSFADFDQDGRLVGGMAFNMNEVDPSLNLTATISATLKGFFTHDEQVVIEAAFNEKGWVLAW